MIELTYEAAIDAIFAHFNAAWTNGELVSIYGYQPVLHFQGVEAKPDFSKLWARLSQQTVLERQASISACVGSAGRRRYQTSGLVFVQLFCPRKDGDSYTQGRSAARISRNAFRGREANPIDLTLAPDNRVIFRNARINELEPENDSFRFNVVSEYDYDEIG